MRERGPSNAALLASDEDAQDVLVLNLGRAVQLCVDNAAHLLAESRQPVPPTMGEAFASLTTGGVIDADLAGRLRRAVDFRNIAVQNYDVMDWDIVSALAGEPLADFERLAAQVMARM